MNNKLSASKQFTKNTSSLILYEIDYNDRLCKTLHKVFSTSNTYYFVGIDYID